MAHVNNAVIVSDIHAGCAMAVCPIGGCPQDDGGLYLPSQIQAEFLWPRWLEWWNEWVPRFTRDEPWVLVVNGDCIDGLHHDSVTQFTHNLERQEECAVRLFEPIIRRPQCTHVYWLRGTEAHGGKSGQSEERVARILAETTKKVVPTPTGRFSRWRLHLRIGTALIDVAHHIGTTGSMAYETSAIQKELEQLYVNAARWEKEKPDVVVRSHRHTNAETRVRMKKNGQSLFATSCVTAGWQLKTPFAHRTAGARAAIPQIGGTVVRCGDEEIYTRHQVWDIETEPIEVPTIEENDGSDDRAMAERTGETGAAGNGQGD